MNYEIKFHNDALKYLQKQDRTTRNRMLDDLNILASNPKHPELDIKRMQGINDLYRLRVGSFRIVYSIHENELVVIIIKLVLVAMCINLNTHPSVKSRHIGGERWARR